MPVVEVTSSQSRIFKVREGGREFMVKITDSDGGVLGLDELAQAAGSVLQSVAMSRAALADETGEEGAAAEPETAPEPATKPNRASRRRARKQEETEG